MSGRKFNKYDTYNKFLKSLNIYKQIVKVLFFKWGIMVKKKLVKGCVKSNDMGVSKKTLDSAALK